MRRTRHTDKEHDMSRYQQRKRQRLANPQIAAGYWEMDAELRLIDALDRVRQHEHLTHEEVARRVGRHRAAISRLFNAEHPNPTLDTLAGILKAFHYTAEIRLRPSGEDEPPFTVVDVDLAQKAGA